jgi:hypothetical protein
MNIAPKVNGRLEALRKRQDALKTAIALEIVREQKKKERDEARLFSIIGAAAMRYAAKHPEFRLALKDVLQAATSLGDGERKLLREAGL